MKTAAETSLPTRLGLACPIIQAPMAGVSTPALAAAVSNAGGLGSIGIGAANAAQARDMIQTTRALTARPFNVNVFCHAPASARPQVDADWLAYLAPCFAEFGATPPDALHEIYRSFLTDDDTLQLLLTERPAVASFHFGLPDAAAIAALRAAGIVLLATATSLYEAQQIEAAGLDGIVAQGMEAGGHRGMFDPAARDEALGTLALTRLLVQRTALPVIAAGGIMDGAGIAAALALGAQAAQLGTAFIACPESAADAAYRARLAAGRLPTTLTTAISGRPARGLSNRLTEMGAAPGAPLPPDYPIAYDAGKALAQAAKQHGNAEFAAHWAGQAYPLARALPAAQLMTVLQTELQQAAGSLGA
jgi:nitronate monooxygenase